MWLSDRNDESGARSAWIAVAALGLASFSLITQCVHIAGAQEVSAAEAGLAPDLNQELARVEGLRRSLEDLTGRIAAVEARPDRDLATQKERVAYLEQKLKLVDEALLRSLEAVDELKRRVERVETAR